MVILVIIAFIAMCFALDAAVQYSRKKKASVLNHVSVVNKSFGPSSVTVPKGLYYDKSHTWAFMEKSGQVRIGIDDFLFHVTGRITRINLKKAGEKIRKGEVLANIMQNGKQIAVISPVSGIISIQNTEILDHSEKVCNSPYNDGWLYMVEPLNWMKEIQYLFNADIYQHWLVSEFSRLRDFLAFVSKESNPELRVLVLQEGGELKDHILEEMGPEVWEDFQTRFLNIAK
jgi:glycine cleavage system H lipoate-binding protein